jgi:16S rRNA (adenine1518-N6/adenine1519-N6)-dimethyltransferase
MYKKKSLGQHFLHNPHYLGLVADAARIQKGECVLEIGPGDGALTKVLLERGARVVALEKDARLVPLLKEKFPGKEFEAIEGDALEYEPLFKNYKVVGNIPYYITGALIRKFLSGARKPSQLVFLLQKEVAERIARAKKESILSLSVKAYGTVRYVTSVPRGAFAPPPAVDSAILSVENISRDNFSDDEHERKFFELVKKGFSSKRKLLRSNLGLAPEALEAAGIAQNARAEDVPLEKWLLLSTARGR